MRSFDSTTGQETWITPPQLQQSLGHFDLDPCAADVMPYKTADVMITKEQDGLNGGIGRNLNIHQTLHRFLVFFFRDELHIRCRSLRRILIVLCHLLLLFAKWKPLS